MQTQEVLEEIYESGGKLKVVDGGLKAKNLNESTRFLVKHHKTAIISLLTNQKPPYIKNGSELIIPMGCNRKYHWWDGGQSIFRTLLELDAPDTLIEQHIGELGSPRHWREWEEILKRRIAARPVAGGNPPSLQELFKKKPEDVKC